MMAAMPDLPEPGDSGIANPRIPWRTLCIGWVLMILAAGIYANIKHVPLAVAVPVAIAFAVELPFYVMAGKPPVWLRRPHILAATCLAPYLIYSLPTGMFTWAGFALLAALVLVLSSWYALLPRSAWFDVVYVILLAAVLLSKLFSRIYLSPIPRVEISTLGHVMLIRTAAVAIIGMRGGVSAQYTFIPKRGEWLTGLKWFGFMLPPILLVLWGVGLWTPREHPNYWTLVPQFLGILWVVALSEEFFFRGLLQNWMETWSGNRNVGLLVTSLMFGSVHLWFRKPYPNWRFAAVATIFGLFCGLAWREKRSVPASMVTHALGATLYRVFFQ